MSVRKYARLGILDTDEFLDTAEMIQTMLLRKSWALIGGLAVSHYANPPVTVDVDILIDSHQVDLDDFSDAFHHIGWKSKPLFFPSNMRGRPKSGVAFKRSNPTVILDALFTGKDKFLKRSIVKSGLIKLKNGRTIPVVSPEDLIIIKSMAGREKDLEDISDMYETMGDRLDTRYIRKTLERLE